MIAGGEVLLLAEEAVGRELADLLGRTQCRALTDAYEALEEMGRQRWATVVLSAGGSDFAGLCRASRRLQRDCKLYALCSPAVETEVRPLLDGSLDDYFIYPLTRSEIATLRTATIQPTGEPIGAYVGSQPASANGPFNELIEAAQSVAALE